jgi:8-hydroxy-5-deazaflavin:NADPH oxidoreductase
MKIAILGTGNVGQTLAAKLVSLGYEVMIGTRDVKDASSRTSADRYGNPGFGSWLKDNKKVKLGTNSEASSFGQLVINATNGAGSLAALTAANASNMKDKIIVDIANPLDFSSGTLALIPDLSNTNSLGEEIQRSFPMSKVVKTLNTMWCGLMVDPGMIGDGDHINYISGNDPDAKKSVIDILKKIGWKKENIIDLGDISGSRATEAILPIWLRVRGVVNTGAFNFKIVK